MVSVRPSRGIKGLAPCMSSSILFWIRTANLKLPPTFRTNSSDLRSSIILRLFPFLLDNSHNPINGLVKVIVDNGMTVTFRLQGKSNLSVSLGQTVGNDSLDISTAIIEPTPQSARGRRQAARNGMGTIPVPTPYHYRGGLRLP